MVQGTRDLVEASKQAGVTRLVLQSALGTEEGRGVAPYYDAKWEEEQAVKYSGIEHVIFRPSFIFGRDGGLLVQQIKVVRFSPVVPVLGRHRMQPIWVDDVASLFTAAVSADEAPNRTFDVGGPDRLTWAELHEQIRKTLGKRRLAFQMPPGPAQGRCDGRPDPASLPRRPRGGGDARLRRQRRRHPAGDRGLRRPADRRQRADSPGCFLRLALDKRPFAPKLRP